MGVHGYWNSLQHASGNSTASCSNSSLSGLLSISIVRHLWKGGGRSVFLTWHLGVCLHQHLCCQAMYTSLRALKCLHLWHSRFCHCFCAYTFSQLCDV